MTKRTCPKCNKEQEINIKPGLCVQNIPCTFCKAPIDVHDLCH